jgi:hypothetical protein
VAVHYYGNSTTEEGDIWVDAEDVGPIDAPADLLEPEWPDPPLPDPTPVNVAESSPMLSAPQIPDEHVSSIVAAARVAEIEPWILAATAARESRFNARLFRAQRDRAFVLWRASADEKLERQPDGSIGACQVLRSRFSTRFGIDNDTDAFELATNYRIAAQIIRENFAALARDRSKAVAAFRVGQDEALVWIVPASCATYSSTVAHPWASGITFRLRRSVSGRDGSPTQKRSRAT